LTLVEGFRVYAETNGITGDASNYRESYWTWVKQKQNEASTGDMGITFPSWHQFDVTKSLVHTLKAPPPTSIHVPRPPWLAPGLLIKH
jgi:hypothetical protein